MEIAGRVTFSTMSKTLPPRKQEAEIKLEWIRQHCLDTIDTARKYKKWAIKKNKIAEELIAAAAIGQLEYILKTFFDDE